MKLQQTEFPFAGPPILTKEEQWAKWMTETYQVLERINGGPIDWSPLYEAVAVAAGDYKTNGPSIPMTIVVGKRNQPEFAFGVELYHQLWRGFEVKMHCDTHTDEKLSCSCSGLA